ncbi:ATP-binding protein, Mn [Streptococcus pneumoniae]|nr:ATP-binding protein, Mn [Streptococcus pneumoniae]
MWDERHKRIGDLSGGQKQRICLARIFATDPDLFVLDEPTAGMDKASRERFYHLLHHACAHHGKAILMVTHEEEALEQYVDKHIHLQRKEDSPWRCWGSARISFGDESNSHNADCGNYRSSFHRSNWKIL